MLKKGCIIDAGTPQELMKKIEGKVWKTIVSEDSVAEMQNTFKVINIQNNEAGVTFRILSEVKPNVQSIAVEPSLEDYYLYIFSDIL